MKLGLKRGKGFTWYAAKYKVLIH